MNAVRAITNFRSKQEVPDYNYESTTIEGGLIFPDRTHRRVRREDPHRCGTRPEWAGTSEETQKAELALNDLKIERESQRTRNHKWSLNGEIRFKLFQTMVLEMEGSGTHKCKTA